mmetsp:Transcript_783/g.1760  ORF Transcript_783/g.1760 Transcript_783/m.1760 type:complete len:223 (-) Transcript_783:379-1047(-)
MWRPGHLNGSEEVAALARLLFFYALGVPHWYTFRTSSCRAATSIGCPRSFPKRKPVWASLMHSHPWAAAAAEYLVSQSCTLDALIPPVKPIGWPFLGYSCGISGTASGAVPEPAELSKKATKFRTGSPRFRAAESWRSFCTKGHESIAGAEAEAGRWKTGIRKRVSGYRSESSTSCWALFPQRSPGMKSSVDRPLALMFTWMCRAWYWLQSTSTRRRVSGSP